MKLELNKDYNFLIPYDVPMLRVGDIGDCGYVIAKKSLRATNLISLGLGTNWSFDKQWLELNPVSVIHGYDGTIFPEEFPEELKKEYKSFFKGQVVHFTENVSASNIDQILKRVSGDTFLKMDIEGSEYDLISSISKANHLIGLAIEFHALDLENCKNKFKSAIELLSADYKIVHVHANNFGGICEDSLPHTLVISFLRKDLCKTEKKRYDCYLEGLDSPNALNSEEYKLYFIGEE